LQPEEVKLVNFSCTNTNYPHGHGLTRSDETAFSVNQLLKYVNINKDDKQYGWIAHKFHDNQICKNMDYFFNIPAQKDIACMDQFSEDQGQDNNTNISDSKFKDNQGYCVGKIENVKNITDTVSQLDYFDLKDHSVGCKSNLEYSNNEKITELDYFEIDSSIVRHECKMYNIYKSNYMYDMDYFSDDECSPGVSGEMVDSAQQVDTHRIGVILHVALQVFEGPSGGVIAGAFRCHIKI
jgi:hypothetical protein